MKIPFFPYSKLYLTQREEFINIFDDVCSRGAYILQKDLEDLESNLANYLNIKHVYGVANGTDALQIALMSLDLKPGDEIITSNFTFAATVEVIALLKLKPALY